MKFVVHLAEVFGPHLSDGAKAVIFRREQIDPQVALNDIVIFDFTGVTTANSSFINALICGLVRELGTAAAQKLQFKGCRPAIQVLIQSALFMASQPCPEPSEA